MFWAVPEMVTQTPSRQAPLVGGSVRYFISVRNVVSGQICYDNDFARHHLTDSSLGHAYFEYLETRSGLGHAFDVDK